MVVAPYACRQAPGAERGVATSVGGSRDPPTGMADVRGTQPREPTARGQVALVSAGASDERYGSDGCDSHSASVVGSAASPCGGGRADVREAHVHTIGQLCFVADEHPPGGRSKVSAIYAHHRVPSATRSAARPRWVLSAPRHACQGASAVACGER